MYLTGVSRTKWEVQTVYSVVPGMYVLKVSIIIAITKS